MLYVAGYTKEAAGSPAGLVQAAKTNKCYQYMKEPKLISASFLAGCCGIVRVNWLCCAVVHVRV